jgi:FdhD protein
MVLKTVVGRTPLMVSRSIPSNLAVEIADKLGVTLVGRAFGPDPIVYTYPWRVVARKQEKVIYKNLLFSIHNISVDKLPLQTVLHLCQPMLL